MHPLSSATAGFARYSRGLMVFEQCIWSTGLAVGLMVFEQCIRSAGLAVGLMVFEQCIRSAGLAVGLILQLYFGR
jgi:hypothetical protein